MSRAVPRVPEIFLHLSNTMPKEISNSLFLDPQIMIILKIQVFKIPRGIPHFFPALNLPYEMHQKII